jgi:hypothetical protein
MYQGARTAITPLKANIGRNLPMLSVSNGTGIG